MRNWIFIFAVSLFMSTAQAKQFGLGVILGSPTGISGKLFTGKNQAIDGAAAWSFGDYDAFHLHGDYLWHRPHIFDIEGEPFTLYYGIGARLISWESRKPRYNHDWALGPRIPLGITYTFRDPVIELFGEVALVMDLVPETDADLDLGIGGRFYF